jgi:hypothetical protein
MYRPSSRSVPPVTAAIIKGEPGVARQAEVARQALDGSEIAITDPMERQRYSLVNDLD